MTKRDYVMFADVLRRTRPVLGKDGYPAAIAAWRYIRRDLMEYLKQDNARFDPDRFIAATEKDQAE